MQVVVVRDGMDRRTDVYVDTLRLAFEGSADSAGSPSAYLAGAVDLGIRILEPAGRLARGDARRLVEGALDTIFVVIGGWPDDADELRRVSGDREVVIVPAPPERDVDEFQGPRPADGVESALAPVVTALWAMERARHVLASRMSKGQCSPGSAGSMTLFVSHAKVDGVAVARSWGLPIMVVDLRKEQYHDSALLPFDVVPSVRVHDGNLIRVVLHAMAVHLRALRVQSVAPGVKVLPHRPSVYSLSGGVQANQASKIAYPAPKLPRTYVQAVAPILRRGSSHVQLVTFDEL